MPTTYYPHPALKPLAQYPLEVRGRMSAERRICRRVIAALFEAGYSLRVHGGEDWETPRVAKGQKGAEATLMRALFNLDDARIVARKGDERAWVYFVFGNCGWDVVNDYTTDLEDVLKPVNDYADSLA